MGGEEIEASIEAMPQRGAMMLDLSAYADSAMSQLRKTIDRWIGHHLTRHAAVRPRGVAGSFHRSELDGVALQEQVANGWTNLSLRYYGSELASARYRWTDELRLEWES